MIEGLYRPSETCSFSSLRVIPLRVMASPHRYSWFHSEETVQLYYSPSSRFIKGVVGWLSAGGAKRWPRLDLVKSHMEISPFLARSTIRTIDIEHFLGSATDEEGALDVY